MSSKESLDAVYTYRTAANNVLNGSALLCICPRLTISDAKANLPRIKIVKFIRLWQRIENYAKHVVDNYISPPVSKSSYGSL